MATQTKTLTKANVPSGSFDPTDKLAYFDDSGSICGVAASTAVAQCLGDPKALYDGVFIFAMTNDTNSYRRLIKPSKWATYKNECTAIGIAVQSGDKLLIVSLTETTLNWSTAQVTGSGVNNSNRKLAIRDWAGETNTAAQVTHSECSGTNCATGWCHAYSRLNPNRQGLGAGTWWLPSLGELLLIYANFEKINYVLSLIAGATQLAETNYWSSSEYSATSAWFILFTTGLVDTYNKVSNSIRVRAVSAFQ